MCTKEKTESADTNSGRRLHSLSFAVEQEITKKIKVRDAIVSSPLRFLLFSFFFFFLGYLTL